MVLVVKHWIRVMSFHCICLIIIIINEELIVHIHIITEIERQILCLFYHYIEIYSLSN